MINKRQTHLSVSLSVHVEELVEVEPGPLHHLHLPNVHVLQGVDALAGLHDVAGNRVGDELVDDPLQVVGADLLGDDVDHLLADSADLKQ